MKIYRSLDELPALKHAVVTLGTFDGVHRGHRKILDRVNEVAAQKGGESLLLTFWPHPRIVLHPEDHSLQLLNTIDEKIELLQKAGLQHLVIAPFTKDFSRLSYMEFIRDVLVNTLHVKDLIIGHDHHFGKNREGTFEQLQECAPLYGFGLEQVSALEENGVAISSSKIRNALKQADLEKANHFLGYPYMAHGEVVEGFKRGRELGYPTANIHIPENYKLLPAEGIYVVRVKCLGSEYKGMASLGYNPTFNNTHKTLEVNILDFNKEIYGEKIEVRFLSFLRKETKFADIAQLIRQLDEDKQNTLDYFSNL